MNTTVTKKTHILKIWVAAFLVLALCLVPVSVASNRSNALLFGGFTTNQYPSGGQTGGTVVDISSYSTGVDFDVMLEHGLSGVMLRAANGYEKDSSFDNYYLQATLRNIPVGAYHYVYWCRQPDLVSASTMAVQEANFLIQCLQGKNIRGYVALDLECPYDSQVKLSPGDLTTVANSYLSILKGAGYKPLVYCNMNWVTNHLEVSRLNAPLWLAYYYDTGSDEFPETNYGDVMRSLQNRIVLWQYSSKGNRAYWGGTTDLNHLYYSFTG
ncbi:MAG: hypothetical protein IJ720_04730 [Clostridia bacterium]|nr:hypothetical protein [Clostridia bacterium]